MATLDRFCADPWLGETCDCPPLEGLDPERQQLFAEMAAHMIWKATKSRFGPCPVRIRPCREPGVCCGRCGGGWYGPPLCGCDRVYELVLPGPVTEILQVLVDGEAVPPAEYRVDDYAWLVNLVAPWPRCQDIAAGFDEAGAFTVDYLIGMAPPAGAGLVTAELACELAKAFCNDTSCQLPRRIASKTRQGVQVTYEDLEDGKTGITSVDTWVAMTNLGSRPSRVFTPDLPSHRSTTWPAPTFPEVP